MTDRFARTSGYIWGGLLVWAADFLFVYVFAALACARGFADNTLAGLPVTLAATILATVAAAGANAALGWRSFRRMRRCGQHAPARFVGFLAMALGALGMLALIWTLLPALMLSHSC